MRDIKIIANNRSSQIDFRLAFSNTHVASTRERSSAMHFF